MKYEIEGDDLIYDIGSGRKTLYLGLFLDYMKSGLKEKDLFTDSYAKLYNLIKKDHPELFL